MTSSSILHYHRYNGQAQPKSIHSFVQLRYEYKRHVCYSIDIINEYSGRYLERPQY
jgi:hypothetical protein